MINPVTGTVVQGIDNIPSAGDLAISPTGPYAGDVYVVNVGSSDVSVIT